MACYKAVKVDILCASAQQPTEPLSYYDIFNLTVNLNMQIY